MKRASVLLIGLIGLCSLVGCGGKRPEVPTPPAVLILPDCPSPERPRLPLINGDLPFDSPENIKIFLERDDIMRVYIKGLEAAALCYRRNSIQGEPKE